MEINYINVDKDDFRYLFNIKRLDDDSVNISAKLDTGATRTCSTLKQFKSFANVKMLWPRIQLKARKYGVFETPFVGIGSCSGILVHATNILLQDELVLPDFYFDLLNIDRITTLVGVDIIDQFTMYKKPHSNIALDDFDFDGYYSYYSDKKALPLEEVLCML